MKILNDSETAITRPAEKNLSEIKKKVSQILLEVRQGGDSALKELSTRFDGIARENFRYSEDELGYAASKTPLELKRAIEAAKKNIEKFHSAYVEEGRSVSTAPGILCWRRPVALESVGLYVPGGTAPLFSTVLMLAIPAQIAGVKRLVLCSPPQKDGSLHPAIALAAKITGVTEVYGIGGSHAIAAMAYGTESIKPVVKICGPGNQYVTVAKQLVSEDGVAFEMPAGPSEVLIVADEKANPAWVASDMLAQLEHGADSQAVLLTTSMSIAERVSVELEKQISTLPREALAQQSLAQSKIVVVSTLARAMEISNTYAPEHLILAVQDPRSLVGMVVNAGSVFLGAYSAEALGDYATGPNHTLPTSGYAKAWSGVSVDTFVRKITFQEVSAEGLKGLEETVTTLARGEGLEAHARAVEIRRAS